jgi:cytochrome c553
MASWRVITGCVLGMGLVLGGSGSVLAQGAPLAAQGCLGCHGPNGAGQVPIPGITGRPAAETEALMKAFRANERPGTIMGRIARGYTDAEIAAMAAFFAAQPR